MTDLGDFFYKGPSITLKSGQAITLQDISQTLTYANILEGIPYEVSAEEMADLHLKWAQDRFKSCKVMLLAPRLRPVPGVEAMHIGNVCCTAIFESDAINEETFMISQLVIVWFQDGFAWPIDPSVVQQIKALDWNNLAIDVSYD